MEYNKRAPQGLFALFLFSLIFISSAPSLAVTFTEVVSQKITGFDKEDQSTQRKALDEASAYAFYRQYPESRRGEDFVLACRSEGEVSRFCDVVVKPSKPSKLISMPPQTRRTFFTALLSLDNPATRSQKCPRAVQQLNQVLRDPQAGRLRARSLYWQWVCATDEKTKESLRERIAKEHTLSLQNLLIAEATGENRIQELINGKEDWPVAFRSSKNPGFNKIIQGLEALISLGEDGAAAVIERNYGSDIQQLEPEVQLYLSALMNQVSESVPSVLPITRMLMRLVTNQRNYLNGTTLKLLFPSNYNLYLIREARTTTFDQLIEEVRGDIEWSLLAGLIHHESAINPRAASSASAYGLAQLLVPTAKDVYDTWSERSSFPVNREMLFDPKINLQLAVMDFNRRFRRFNGRLAVALASYNAGETAVEEWVKRSPVMMDERIQADLLFMNESRDSRISDYVSSVLAKRYWYKALYQAQTTPIETQPETQP